MDPLRHFKFRDVGKRLEDLETPVPVIDIDVVMANLTRWQAQADRMKIANRPHIKTHKLVPLAKLQLDLGAKGITVQKLGEAEVMADAGITDMLLTFNVVGAPKIARLAALARRTSIKVVADNRSVVDAVAEAGRSAGRDISILVECDTGARRNGVTTAQDALHLAQYIDQSSGAEFGGLMVYPPVGGRLATDAFMTKARALCHASGLNVATTSTGGTPDMWNDEGLTAITEYRAGTYIYFDRSLEARGTCTFSDCALTVLATVVSTPSAERAVMDAGSKSLTSDLLGLTGHGAVPELGEVTVSGMSEEHGILDIREANRKPKVGDLVRIVPNHVCPVSNLFDEVVMVRGTDVLGAVTVDARGKMQ